MLVPIKWLSEHAELADGITAEKLAEDLVAVGLEEEAIHSSGVTGPLVFGKVLEFVQEPQSNGKTINWCTVDVGENEPRGIVCGAPNITNDQVVVVALPGTSLPTDDGDFVISKRKTYGHFSDGMICSSRELGLGDDHDGILDLSDKTDITIGASAIEYLGVGTQVLEINITPDRGYCFSYRGIGREYALSTGSKFIDKVASLSEKVPGPSAGAFEVLLQDQAPIRSERGPISEGCSRFATRVVKGIDKNAESPEWLKRYLTEAGMRPISLIVDVSNFVMLDLGQPIHHYDLDRVIAPIVVRRANEGETLTTLDDKKRQLSTEDLLITDDNGKRIIGLAGVMGGQSTEIEDDTTNVLIEAAFFDPISIYRTAKRHKLPSEASKRFERTIDNNIQAVAAQACVDLLLKYGGPNAKVTDQVGDINNTVPRKSFELKFSKVADIIGVDIPVEQCVEILQKVGCSNIKNAETIITLTPPSWRPDLNIAEDYIEEIARVYGYDKIPSTLPSRDISNAKRLGLTPIQKSLRKVSDALALAGWNEVMSYPFVGVENFKNMLIPADDPRCNAVKLSNPIAEQYPFMRTEILQSLLPIASLNIRRSNDSFKIFEQGLVYQPRKTVNAPSFEGGYKLDGKDLGQINAAVPLQPLKIAGIIVGAGQNATSIIRPNDTDYFDAIETIETLSNALFTKLSVTQVPGAYTPKDQLQGNQTPGDREPGTQDKVNVSRMPFHPYRFGEISTGRKSVGVIGELHPTVCDNFNLPHHSVAFELNLNALNIDLDNPIFEAKLISKFPPVKQDLSVLVPTNASLATVQKSILETPEAEIETADIIDIFESEKLGPSVRSVTFSIKFRSLEKTLSPEEQKTMRSNVLKVLQKQGIELRA
jgi:phenylalanyl-tRNA synthetase beta chain